MILILLSPLLGSLIATLMLLFYAIIKSSIGLNNIGDVLSIFPILFFIVTIVSYFFSLPLGYWLNKKQEEYFFSDSAFMFYSFLLGSFFGLAFFGINFYLEESWGKGIIIFFAFSLGALFNSSFYVSLRKELKK